MGSHSAQGESQRVHLPLPTLPKATVGIQSPPSTPAAETQHNTILHKSNPKEPTAAEKMGDLGLGFSWVCWWAQQGPPEPPKGHPRVVSSEELPCFARDTKRQQLLWCHPTQHKQFCSRVPRTFLLPLVIHFQLQIYGSG